MFGLLFVSIPSVCSYRLFFYLVVFSCVLLFVSSSGAWFEGLICVSMSVRLFVSFFLCLRLSLFMFVCLVVYLLVYLCAWVCVGV